MKRFFSVVVVLAISILSVHFLRPDEGMWLMTQVSKLPFQEMKSHGLELTPDQIYNPNGTSLKDAVVLLPGGTGSFVSADGLIITNHHIVYGALQSVSSVKEDYLKDGMYAKTHEEEIPVPSYFARIVVSIKDVTDDILTAVSDTMTPVARSAAIRKKTEDLQKAAKGTGDIEYEVSSTFSGGKYLLYGFQVMNDVRLVYAPPSSIGNYGGEVDNWYWPRHTGDFGFMRAYVAPDGKPAKYSKDNVPYKPKIFLPISSKPLETGSFAMIMGYPGRTFRYRTSAEVQLSRDQSLPMLIDLYKTRMDIMEAAGKKDRAVEIQYASTWRGLANAYKNYEGTLEGMRRADILTVRQQREKEFGVFLQKNPELNKKYGTILADIAKATDEVRTFNKEQLVMSQIYGSSAVLRIAQRFSRLAKSFAKDSASGDMKPPEKNVKELRDFLGTAFKNVTISVDKDELVAMMLKATELPSDQSIRSIQQIVGQSTDGADKVKEINEFVDNLYHDSKLTTEDGCLKLLEKSADDIQDDRFVKFVSMLDNDNEPLQAKSSKLTSAISLLDSRYIEALMAWKGENLYPDANRSLRLTYGVIKPYDPRDAVHYDDETTLGGVIEKETGEDPFIVPPKLHDLWVKKDFGRWADPKLHDVPVAFLANLDITGGNSGSPVINGKGELIGVAFDGNWESVVGDYIYQEPLNRAINVEARYVLFILDKYSNAQNILNELVIH
ncbi:MAG TPA: S46 family peptidase [Bacteroidota bacterium]|nr:S46 family peptidase [Bacteroidota bacterium]